MLTALLYKTKHFLHVLIKLSLVLAAFYMIYVKLFRNSDLSFPEFLQNLMKFSSISSISVIILLFLSISNWFFEIKKWQTLVSSITEISFIEAKAQSLGALTASLWTPNRIGDYGAKALYFQASLRKKIMLLNLVGNSAQMGVTTGFGTVGLGYYVLHFYPEFNHKAIFIWLATFIAMGLLVISILRTKWFGGQKKTINRLFVFIKKISHKIILKVVLSALVRYLIFSLQFYYLLHLFGVDINFMVAMTTISSMYLLASIIPSILIFDVVVKGGIAVYLFGLIGVSEPVVLSVVTLIWILNFALPSVIGSYYMLRHKLPKTVS
ncbi:flippase-like domain-containing protein [Gelidibacter gilvus]|uniref:Flippase-like domain-containing protein n=2 Tax=Gelidibacter maritimus TaxID=2761487 RepID=A0A7W2M5N1_9FLAO|nr:flippase-like domain-containing protein [Gelidibacter maritimus]